MAGRVTPDTTSSLKCAAVPRRARIEGSWTFVSLNSRLESNEEEEGSHTGYPEPTYPVAFRSNRGEYSQ